MLISLLSGHPFKGSIQNLASKKKFSENNYICNLTTVRVSDVMGWWLDLIMNKLTPHAIAAQYVYFCGNRNGLMMMKIYNYNEKVLAASKSKNHSWDELVGDPAETGRDKR